MTIRIGLLVFPGVQPLDLIGPYDVFAALPDTEPRLVWKDRAPVQAHGGLWLTPEVGFDECEALDVLCVPGGSGIGALLEDAQTLAFVREQGARVRYLTSVCTGALVLGAAGLLRGRRATTHWAFHELLAPFGAQPVHARVVRDGNLLTGGGITAGIDFALTLAAELHGTEAAQLAQLGLEDAPAPPFEAGVPETAPPAIVAQARDKQVELLARRRAIVARAAAALG
jgi:cyclohexyl-isocyanide hydratase